eukprot:433614-Prymnesium_polylepis.2
MMLCHHARPEDGSGQYLVGGQLNCKAPKVYVGQMIREHRHHVLERQPVECHIGVPVGAMLSRVTDV